MRIKWVTTFGLVLGVLVSACSTPVPKNAMGVVLPTGYQPFEWPRDFGGLPLAGALVQISPTQGFRYLITLQECGLDKEVLTPIHGVMAIPSFTLDESADANLAFGLIKVVNLEASAKAAKKIKVEVGLTTDEMLIPGRIVQNAIKHNEKLIKQCGNFLKLKGVFWISDALKSRSFKLTFHDEKGGKIAVKAEQLPYFVSKASAGVDISATADGEVEVRTPVYVGFRYAAPAELLTGEIQTFTKGETGKPIVFGDELFAQHRAKLGLPAVKREE